MPPAVEPTLSRPSIRRVHPAIHLSALQYSLYTASCICVLDVRTPLGATRCQANLQQNKPVKSISWPWLEPFSVRESLNWLGVPCRSPAARPEAKGSRKSWSDCRALVSVQTIVWTLTSAVGPSTIVESGLNLPTFRGRHCLLLLDTFSRSNTNETLNKRSRRVQ